MDLVYFSYVVLSFMLKAISDFSERGVCDKPGGYTAQELLKEHGCNVQAACSNIVCNVVVSGRS